jgi:Domain of unknown function (DUF1992)
VDWLESLVERRIREAAERGAFDDLPGAGKPLDLTDADDPDWWVKRYARRENLDLTAALPGPLALRREAEGFPASLADLTREEQVRAVLEDFNRRVVDDWRRPVAGPSLPVYARPVDVEALLGQWRELRPQPVDRRPVDESAGVFPRDRERSRRRWWRRGDP